MRVLYITMTHTNKLIVECGACYFKKLQKIIFRCGRLFHFKCKDARAVPHRRASAGFSRFKDSLIQVIHQD